MDYWPFYLILVLLVLDILLIVAGITKAKDGKGSRGKNKPRKR
jgi:hypothetical protein